MKFVFILVSVWMMYEGYAMPMDSVRSEQREEGLFVVHEVEEQETIYSIAKRYNGSVLDIIKHNQIVDNRIEIGQVIYVLVASSKNVKELDQIQTANIHIVQPGETLYSISRVYQVKVKDLKEWNDLSNNAIAPGMKLKISTEVSIGKNLATNQDSLHKRSADDTVMLDQSDPLEGFKKYLVQTGETLATIATKIGVSIDSLKEWNGLQGDYIKIGQQLLFKNEGKEEVGAKLIAPNNIVRTQIDDKGFERVYQEGVASVIEDLGTTRYLALHRALPIGTNLKVRNLMNNQVVHVKVVGKLPNTGLNKNLLIRISQPAYDQLGILDSKARVEVSYVKQ